MKLYLGVTVCEAGLILAREDCQQLETRVTLNKSYYPHNLTAN